MIYNIFGTNMNAGDKLLSIVALIAAIVFAIVIHEFSHGYVAKLNGDRTAQFSGRLTLNPVKHFDLWGVMMFLFVGFGWAKPVPVDYRNFRNLKKGIFTVALAGVTANLIVTIISLILLYLLVFLSSIVNFNSIVIIEMLTFLIVNFLIFSILINSLLISFNLLPIYPLDGFRVVEAFAKPNNRYVNFMRSYGIYVLLGLLLSSSFLGRISPYLDPLGLYLSFFRSKLLLIINIIFS